MTSQCFRAVLAAGPRDSAVIMMPFDPDEAWGAKADHPVSGTISGYRTRTRLVPAGSGWGLLLAAKRLIAYLRWIDATTRRPELREARINEVIGLLAAGVKERSAHGISRAAVQPEHPAFYRADPEQSG